MTINEAIKQVMRDNGAPMTLKEIYDSIVRKNLYVFHAQNPYGIVAGQVRRHCKGIDFSTASSTKHFVLTEGNKFFFLDTPIKGKRERRKKQGKTQLQIITSQRPESSLQKLKELHLIHKDFIKKKVLSDLKKMSPGNFEIFAKRLLEKYGFNDMKVTNLYKDGGIDGHGKLKIGLAHMNVAFQCKRWTRGSVGRPDIDKFRGAIQGKYEQGIFFTTASFVPGAENESFRPGAVPIILIDGNSIVDLMLDKEFGVVIESLPVYSYALDLVLSEENEK